MFDDVIAGFGRTIDGIRWLDVKGRVDHVVGTIVRARVPHARIGDMCLLRTRPGVPDLPAEVIGIETGVALLAPFGELAGISSDTEVLLTGEAYTLEVGDALLGRVVDGFGRPVDPASTGLPQLPFRYALNAAPASAVRRRMTARALPVGVRAIDGLLTCAEGQRMGIFAAAGVGKTSLLSMLINHAEADVCVIGLIGERGREVREFVARELSGSSRQRSVIVAATADRPAMERLKAGFVATTIAEYFRDQGKRVMLVIDSVTRLARAQREIGLAAGEFPARRGFPPSMFALLPRLFERAGLGERGSITAFYSVLVEGDDMNEPVADEVRSLLDGHIVLSRELAERGQYPAIDVLASLSRVMPQVAGERHLEAARKLRAILAKYNEIELLVQLGEYQHGHDAAGDEALDKIARIRRFLEQAMHENIPFSDTLDRLDTCIA